MDETWVHPDQACEDVTRHASGRTGVTGPVVQTANDPGLAKLTHRTRENRRTAPPVDRFLSEPPPPALMVLVFEVWLDLRASLEEALEATFEVVHIDGHVLPNPGERRGSGAPGVSLPVPWGPCRGAKVEDMALTAVMSYKQNRDFFGLVVHWLYGCLFFET